MTGQPDTNGIQIQITTLLSQLSAHTAWYPQITAPDATVPVQAILQQLQTMTSHPILGIACADLTTAEQLQFDADKACELLLTCPIVRPVDVPRLAALAATRPCTLVISHFRHAELAVAAAQAAGRRLSVLVELRLGRHVAGVTAGPDAVHLAAAVLRLPELHLSGLFVRDPCDSEVDAAEQGRALQSAVSMSQHTWQMMQRRQSPGSGRAIHIIDSGTRAPLSLVCGRLPVPLLSEFHGAAVCNPWPVSASISKADIDNRPSTHSISALVIARPTLETCVIACFRPGDGRKVKYRVLSPIGAEVRDCWDHYLTLSVDGPALDLKIGDEVLLSTEFPPD